MNMNLSLPPKFEGGVLLQIKNGEVTDFQMLSQSETTAALNALVEKALLSATSASVGVKGRE